RGVKVTNATTCAACTAPLAGSQNLTVVAPANPVSDLEGAVNVKVYPNPTLGVFNVQVRSADKGGVLIKVLDMQGRLLKEIRTTPYKTNRVGADLRPGLYFLEVSQGKYKSSVKVIKE
ncbi:MAG: hypothetical protein RL732_1241, partial [Bacteroidota bacterium]